MKARLARSASGAFQIMRSRRVSAIGSTKNQKIMTAIPAVLAMPPATIDAAAA